MYLKTVYIAIVYTGIELAGIVFIIITDKKREKARVFTL